MKMKKVSPIIKYSSFIFFLFIGFCARAQMSPSQLITDVRELDLNAMAYDPSNSRVGKTNLLSYADIEGSAFWDDKWNPAIVYFSNGAKAKINQAKLNLYTNEIHYLNSMGTELVVDNQGITRLVFLNPKNVTQPIASFAKLMNHTSGNGTVFYKVLNAGVFQLIVLQKQFVKTSPYDPIQGKSITRFYTKKDYAIYNLGKIMPLDDLNKKSLLNALGEDASFEALVKENKSKLKSENEIVDLLVAYNLSKEKK